jgi:acetyl-CoA carboxylase biotin carboxylase subunit
MASKIRSVLIANRGEIAVRVIRACRETGRRAIAVYSDADRDSLHVRLADAAVRLGPPAAADSYLNVDKVIAAAKATGADAIHPGYGFLSENGDAAQAVEDAGLTWIGPTPESIAAVGDKLRARELARQAGVPLVPGSDGAVAAGDVAALAAEIGAPLLLKAVGGGGGKGIRLVEDLAQVGSALERAMGEAQSAFGSASVYLERCVRPARHIEIQILGDGNGEAIHLGERECSLQRRQQKIVEETPSRFVSPELRERMGAAAVSLAKAVNYRGAGTVEFLVDEAGDFYFLEVNARLQVEHCVTEMVTGLDLVRAQLHVAETGALPFGQDAWQPRGHAIQLRVNAEDPYRGWIPAIGPVRGLRLPSGPFVRVDTFLEEGAEVTPHYDSLLAKLVVWAPTRDEAVDRWAAAARGFSAGDLATTLPLATQLADDAAFRACAFHTGWLEPWVKGLSSVGPTPEARQAAAVAAALTAWEASSRQGGSDQEPARSSGGLAPWVQSGRARRLGRR